MLREKEDTELKPVTTEGDITYIYVKASFVILHNIIEWPSLSISLNKAQCKCHYGYGIP